MEHIGKLEKRLWSSADVLRSTSNFASNEYFMPVMGLIFLRHACSRYIKVRDEILPTLPSRGGKVRDLTKEDFLAAVPFSYDIKHSSIIWSACLKIKAHLLP